MAQEIPTGEGLTFEKVWLMFQETKELMKEAAKERKEMDARIEKSNQEAAKERKEMNARIEKSNQEAAIERKEAAKERKEMDARIEKSNQETNKKISELGEKWGRFVEGVIEPSLVRIFNERGILIQETAQRLKKQMDGESMEVDLLGINGKEVVVVEVKSTLTVEDVRDHLYRMENFKRFFPRYNENRLIGAVAGMVIQEEADKFAYRKGLFVIQPSGDTAVLINDLNFKPLLW